MAEFEINAGTGQKNDAIVKDTTMQTFKQDVIEESKSRIVFLYFYSVTDPVSVKFEPLLEKYVKLANGKAVLVKMTVEEGRAIAMQLGIRGVPTTLIFTKGNMADGFSGPVPEQQLKMLMQALIGKDALSLDELLKEAKAHLENNEINQALDAYTQVLEKDEANQKAFAGMIRCFIAKGDLAAAKDLSDGLEENLKDSELQAARSALNLALAAQNAPKPDDLAQKVAANPDDLQARYDLAQALYAAGKPAEAMDELLEIIARDQKWNDDKARALLFEYFKAIGLMNPLTVEKRHKLSGIIFT